MAALEDFELVIAVEVVAILPELALAAIVMVMAAGQELLGLKVIMMVKDLAIVEQAEVVEMGLITVMEAEEPMESLKQAIIVKAIVTTVPANSKEEIALLVS